MAASRAPASCCSGPPGETALRYVLPGVGERTEIRLSNHGPKAGVLGAALLAKQELKRARERGLMAETNTHDAELDELAVNTIRTLSMDAVQKANSGHPGTPMGLAPLGYVLYSRDHAPQPARTRLDQPRQVRALSAGHACMLQYSLLHLCGYDLSLDDIKSFRQWGSKCPGHPEYGHTPGVEISTGPLGQGFANARRLRARRGQLRPALQSRVRAGRRPPHLRRLRGRRHGGGHLLGGRLARRQPRPRQADRDLRRQRDLDRGLHLARLPREGRRPLRLLRLVGARAARRVEPGADRARHPRGAGRHRPSLAGHPADPHRLRQPEQAGHRRRPRLAARRGGDQADEGEPRLALRGAVHRSRRGLRAVRRRRASAGWRSEREWSERFERYAREHPSSPTTCSA